MPESGAVYQPTTVGYSYDNRDGGLGIRRSFSRIMSRHKFSTRNWFEWVLMTVGIAAILAGFTTMIINLTNDEETETPKRADTTITTPRDSTTEVKEHSNDSRASIAGGAAVMLIGILLCLIWGYLRFFRNGKSPRGGMTSNSGQMLGGLNPSTDLLVGSTSQYGPVLTELPSQLKSKQASSLEVSTAIPMSDQEEETHTLMDENTGPSTITSQIPG
ncbi:uncharacterized protein LOC131672646 isoform X1 [Phymastichus coffea]|uniref:uncharacterized protein LOC131672646 isoform X1 n=1 Tax=Phymastichus coffea TaxID=108790 RepID=UPI00273CC424|nr:uncharacterized protein LOC131672646 isoform X1 [Phymastichus coffea]XP_058806007.1 uncharacterized protein LOC131672646 isoform X1 [Phymastichus coffea]XP_058806008.1 uncharacterized protein LOC131672646 isoform X1 [Phymastichus coffea]